MNSIINNHLVEVQNSINFIEDNLMEDISLEDVLGRAGYSRFHFQRLFLKYSGFTIRDYIRKRRLSAAAEELCRKDRLVIDTAYDYYFSFEQSFIRAFKQEFGITPGFFRSNKVNLQVYQRLVLQLSHDRSPYNSYFQNRMLLNHGLRLAGIRNKINKAENNITPLCEGVKNQFLQRWESTSGNTRDWMLYSIDELVAGDPDHFYTTYCVAIDDETPVPAGMQVYEIPFHVATINPCIVASDDYRHVSENYEDIFDYIYQRYLPASSYMQNTTYAYSTIDLLYLFNTRRTNFTIHIPVGEKK